MKSVALIAAAVFLATFLVSCDVGFKKTSTFYKDEILWGMTKEEVSEKLDYLVVSEEDNVIVAFDNEDEIISESLTGVSGIVSPTYRFNKKGKLYGIEFEHEKKLLDYEDFLYLVQCYQRKYPNLEAGELSADGYENMSYSYCSASCMLDEYTKLKVLFIKYDGMFNNSGKITVEYYHKDLYNEEQGYN